MKQLLWKEFRERRVMAMLWAATLLATTLIGQGQFLFSEPPRMLTAWYAPLLLLTAVIGAGGYRSELTGDRAIFLFSRPVSWRAVLLAKVLYGVLIIVGALAGAALLHRLITPAPYRDFITLSSVLGGIGWLGWQVGALYLFGLACSVGVSGPVGGLVTMAAALILTAALFMIPAQLVAIHHNRLGSWLFESSMQMQLVALYLGAWLAALLAGWRVIRAGVYLGVDDRLKRFAPVYIGLLLLVWVVGAALPLRWAMVLCYTREMATVRASPHGWHALVVSQRVSRFSAVPGDDDRPADMQANIIRLADRSVVMALPPASVLQWQWVTDAVGAYTDENRHIHLVHADTGTEHVVTPPPGYQSSTLWHPSPDGQYLHVAYYRVKSLGRQELAFGFIDTATGAQFGPTPVQARGFWWQDNDTLGYLDKDKRRHFLHVRE